MRVKPTASANLSGSARKPGAITLMTSRHEDLAEENEDEKRRQQHRERILGEKPAPTAAALRGHRAGEKRHEGGGEGAFGKQAAEQIGQALGNEERVGHRAGAEERRGQDIADEAQHAAHHRVASRPSRRSATMPLRTNFRRALRLTPPLARALLSRHSQGESSAGGASSVTGLPCGVPR